MRTASSWRRANVRVSVRFATLAQAINSTNITAPANINRMGRVSVVKKSRSSVSFGEKPEFVFVYFVANPFMMADISARA